MIVADNRSLHSRVLVVEFGGEPGNKVRGTRDGGIALVPLSSLAEEHTGQ